LVKLEKAARGAGLPLNGITLDNPYNYNYHGKDLEGKAVSGDLLDRAIDVEKEVKALSRRRFCAM